MHPEVPIFWTGSYVVSKITSSEEIEQWDSIFQRPIIFWDNYFANDPEYMKLDDAGRDAFVARYNIRDGGMPTGIMRSNKAGVMERDYRERRLDRSVNDRYRFRRSTWL